MGKVRDFSAFKSVSLTPEQEKYIEGCLALDEPPELTTGVEMYIKSVVNRHGWVRSKIRSEALKLSRESRGNYKCASCTNIFKSHEVEVDHRWGRQQPNKSNTLMDYLRRTFPPIEYLAVLCKTCHRAKTAATLRGKE